MAAGMTVARKSMPGPASCAGRRLAKMAPNSAPPSVTVLMSFKRNGELFRTAKDHISIEGGVLIGAPEVLRKPRFTCSRPAIHSTVIA
jgi:hypothetical protein